MMSISRVFQAIPLAVGASVSLSEAASHHLANVLRAKTNDVITLFNGEGGEYRGVILRIEKKKVTVRIDEFNPREAESPLELYLAQGISRGEKMDYTIQKAVELGVKKIIPIFTERCNVKLDAERREKKIQHWQAIAIGACEQSGRNRVPEILPMQTLDEWLQTLTNENCFVLSPHVSKKIAEYQFSPTARVALLIGPEGGLSDQEVEKAFKYQFQPLSLGPRVLRTETAAVAAITALQCCFGDMA